MTAVSIPVDERSGADTGRVEDPILSNRARILSSLAPTEPDVAPPVPRTPAPPLPESDDEVDALEEEPTRVMPGMDPDAGAPRRKAVPAPDFFQMRTPEDDDLLNADDEDGDEWPAKPAPAAPAPGWKDEFASRAKSVSWKSPKTIAILAGVAVVLIVVVLLIVLAVLPKSGPPPLEISKKEDSPSQPNKPVAPPIADGPIKVKSAGEPCKSGGTDPMKAFDGSLDTAWTCKVPYGLGKVVPATLDGPSWVTKVEIVPGYSKIESIPGGGSKDLWNEYSTICAVRWLFDGDPDGGGVILKTGNTRDYVPLTLPKPRLTNTVRMVVTCITPPPSQDGMLKDPTSVPTFATSEIRITGHPASPNSAG